MDDQELEGRISAALEDQAGDDYSYDVNCPDDGVDPGSDFTCYAEPDGLDDVRLRIDTHLGTDGETVDAFDPEPELEQ